MLTASYAKINLFLEVVGRLPNNYHQVNTVLCSIDLCDYIRYELISEPLIKLSCSNPQLEGSGNLIYKLAAYLQQSFAPNKGIRIHLDKKIPIAAGLGGGSSNAAHCLITLNKLWNLHLEAGKLHAIAAGFGSDINFFLLGGTALGENRGEIITPLPTLQIPNILLIYPHLQISAAEAYRLVRLPEADNTRHFNPSDLPGTCYNRLEPGIRKAYPIIDTIICELQNWGAKVAMLSGSGSTCFGIFADENSLTRAQAHFDRQGYWTYIASTIPPILALP